MSTTVTVTLAPEKSVGVTDFSDITTATLLTITHNNGPSFDLTFDATLTADQIAQITHRAEAVNANDETIRNQAYTALANNRTFLALTAPTNADVLAQVKALTRQMNGVIRVVLGQLDGTN